MRNGNKRGVWKYDVNGASTKTDNGIVYTAEEILDEFKRRNAGLLAS